VAISLIFPSGAVAALNCGIRLPFACDLRITGTKGRLEVTGGAMIPGPGVDQHIQLMQEGECTTLVVPETNHYQLTAEAFVRTVRGQQDAVPSLDATIATLRVMDRVRAQFSA
jgi:predicted dehydrogenase